MRAHLIAAASAALLLALTGCASAPDAPAETPAAETSETTGESAPLTAAPVEDEPTVDTPEAAFLAEVRPYVDQSDQIADATDQQLLDAGKDACEQIAAGTHPEQVRVIQGEEPIETGTYVDSSRIGAFAAKHLCS